jgi:hypothetical protein
MATDLLWWGQLLSAVFSLSWRDLKTKAGVIQCLTDEGWLILGRPKQLVFLHSCLYWYVSEVPPESPGLLLVGLGLLRRESRERQVQTIWLCMTCLEHYVVSLLPHFST